MAGERAGRQMVGKARRAGWPRPTWSALALLVGCLGLSWTEGQEYPTVRPGPAQGRHPGQGDQTGVDRSQRATGSADASGATCFDGIPQSRCEDAASQGGEVETRTTVATVGRGSQGFLLSAEEGIRVGHPEAGGGHGGDSSDRPDSSRQGLRTGFARTATGAGTNCSPRWRRQLGQAHCRRAGPRRSRTGLLPGGTRRVQPGNCTCAADSTRDSTAVAPEHRWSHQHAGRNASPTLCPPSRAAIYSPRRAWGRVNRTRRIGHSHGSSGRGPCGAAIWACGDVQRPSLLPAPPRTAQPRRPQGRPRECQGSDEDSAGQTGAGQEFASQAGGPTGGGDGQRHCDAALQSGHSWWCTPDWDCLGCAYRERGADRASSFRSGLRADRHRCRYARRHQVSRAGRHGLILVVGQDNYVEPPWPRCREHSLERPDCGRSYGKSGTVQLCLGQCAFCGEATVGPSDRHVVQARRCTIHAFHDCLVVPSLPIRVAFGSGSWGECAPWVLVSHSRPTPSSSRRRSEHWVCASGLLPSPLCGSHCRYRSSLLLFSGAGISTTRAPCGFSGLGLPEQILPFLSLRAPPACAPKRQIGGSGLSATRRCSSQRSCVLSHFCGNVRLFSLECPPLAPRPGFFQMASPADSDPSANLPSVLLDVPKRQIGGSGLSTSNIIFNLRGLEVLGDGIISLFEALLGILFLGLIRALWTVLPGRRSPLGFLCGLPSSGVSPQIVRCLGFCGRPSEPILDWSPHRAKCRRCGSRCTQRIQAGSLQNACSSYGVFRGSPHRSGLPRL